MKYTVQSAVRKNSKEKKPLEDFLIRDDENGIFIVTDGVSQSAEDYEQTTGRSDAAMAAEISAAAVHEALLREENAEKAFSDGVRTAIDRVAEYNRTSKATFLPASCLVAGCIREGKLNFAYMGDSVIFLLRGNAKIQLAEQQTNALSTYHRGIGTILPKRYRYDNITNNIQSPLGYGVILGDPRALDFLRIASISLEDGDRVIISSDGLDKYLMFTHAEQLRSQSADEMILHSACYDEAPYATYADDKSIIIIDVAV